MCFDIVILEDETTTRELWVSLIEAEKARWIASVHGLEHAGEAEEVIRSFIEEKRSWLAVLDMQIEHEDLQSPLAETRRILLDQGESHKLCELAGYVLFHHLITTYPEARERLVVVTGVGLASLQQRLQECEADVLLKAVDVESLIDHLKRRHDALELNDG
jgi:DNA-binding LytR/AlgR family response regulator